MAEQDERHRAHYINECIMTLSDLVHLWVDGAVAASFGTKWENGFIRTRLSFAS